MDASSDENANDVMQEQTIAAQARSAWDATCEQIARRMLPLYADGFTGQNLSQSTTNFQNMHEMVDSTAALALKRFASAMESMNTPGTSSIPIVLHGEFDRGLAGRMTPGELLDAARAAGLESAPHELRCLAHRRSSEPGLTRQTYFAIVESPAIAGFREQLARTGQGAFDAAALTPIMFVGASDAAFHRWLPIRAGDADCVAPIQIDRAEIASEVSRFWRASADS